MNWQKPEFIQINMSAEIGGYQSDDDHGGIPSPPAVDVICQLALSLNSSPVHDRTMRPEAKTSACSRR